MPVTPSSTVVGVFHNRSTADQAVEALYNAGFERGQMRYIASNTSGGFFEDLKNFFTGTSANTSHAEGDTSNPLAVLGLAPDTAHYYSDEYNKGKPVLVVNAPEREQEALHLLQNHGAYNAHINTMDHVQPLINTPQQSSDETPTPENNAQSWELHSQPLSAQEEEHQQDTEPFSAIKSSVFATPSYDPALYHTLADENIPVSPADPSATPFFTSSAVSDTPQPDVSTTDQEEAMLPQQANRDAYEAEIDAEEAPAYQIDATTPEQETDETNETVTPPSQIDPNTNIYNIDEVATPAYQTNMSEQKADETEDEEALVDQVDVITPGQETDETEDGETPVYQIDVLTPEQEAEDDEETPVDQADVLASEQASDDEEEPGYQADVLILEQEPDDETPASQMYTNTFEQEADEIDQEEFPVYQTNVTAPEQEADEIDQENTSVSQASEYASEYSVDESAPSTPGMDTNMNMETYTAPQATTDSSTPATDVQASSQKPTPAEQAEELRQIQEQIKTMQQQLQDAKAKLEATKELENQYKKRQKQLQNSKKHLQELQEELQATQAELQETEARVASYQYPEMENPPKKSEKQKKAKLKDFKYI